MKRLEAATIKRFGVLTPENAQRLVKTNPGTYGPILEEAKRLWTLGNKWPDVRGNYAGFGGLITAGQQGAAPKASVPAGPSGAPVKGQQRKLSSGTVVTFDGTKWK